MLSAVSVEDAPNPELILRTVHVILGQLEPDTIWLYLPWRLASVEERCKAQFMPFGGKAYILITDQGWASRPALPFQCWAVQKVNGNQSQLRSFIFSLACFSTHVWWCGENIPVNCSHSDLWLAGSYVPRPFTWNLYTIYFLVFYIKLK